MQDDSDFSEVRSTPVAENTGRSFVDNFKRAVSPVVILTLLGEKPMYGYESSQWVNERSKGKMTIPLLYSVLYKMEQQGLIRVVDTVTDNGHTRSYYARTEEGTAYLTRTTAEFRELTEIFLELFEDM